MKVYGDYHTHTVASDGRCSISEHAKVAKGAGIEQIAITDHSFSSTVFHMTRRKFDKQEREIASIKDVKIFHGLEGNILNANGDIDVPCDIVRRSDVLHIGFHRYIGFKGIACKIADRKWLFQNGFCSQKTREKLVEINTQAYINALNKYPVDCVAHLNHRALVDVKKVCETARDRGTYIELNEKHLDVVESFAKELRNSGVNFLAGTDAHSAKKLGKMSKIKDFVEKYDIPLERVYGIDGREPIFKNKKDWNCDGNEF